MGSADLGLRVVILGVGEARRNMGAVNNDLNTLTRNFEKAAGVSSTLATRLSALGSGMAHLGRTMSLTLTLPIAAFGAGMLKAGIDFEDAFAGVSKTVEGVSDNFGNLTKLGQQIRTEFRQLALEIPASAVSLAQIGEEAGALGVPAAQITDFVETVAKFGVATNVSASEAGNALARFANIMGVSSKDLNDFARRAGSAIVDLGNKSAATESEIIAMAYRLAGAGKAAGLTYQEIIALSASISELGVRAEQGGSAVSRILLQMYTAAAEGGESLTLFAKAAGVTSDEFRNLVKSSPIDAFKLLAGGLASMQEEGTLTTDVLNDLELNTIRLRDVVNRFGPEMGNLTEYIKYSNKAAAEGAAIDIEAQKRYATIASQIQLLKNAFAELGIVIFDLYRDDISRLIKGFGSVVKGLSETNSAVIKAAAKIGVLLAVIGPLLVAFGSLFQILAVGAAGWKLLFKAFDLSKIFNFSKLIPSKSLLKLPATAISKTIGYLSNTFGFIFKSALSPVLKIGSSAFSFITNSLPKLVLSTVGKVIFGAVDTLKFGLSALLNMIVPFSGTFANSIFSLILSPFKAVFSLLTPLLGAFSGVLKSTFSLMGAFVGELPKLAGGLLKFLIGPLKQIPLILGSVGAALLLLFAPKVITQTVKNYKAVFSTLSDSVSQFVKDLKQYSVSKAVLLFFGGGSTGSGRKTGIFGLAKALGAGEETAKKFSYALGVAAYWTLRIVNGFKNVIKAFFTANVFASKLNSTVVGLQKESQTTSDRLISFAENVAHFMEGLYKGISSTFDEMWVGGEAVVDAFKHVFKAVGNLFTSIFGEASENTTDFYDSLEKGTSTGATSIGELIGTFLGSVISVGLQIAAIVIEITAQIIDFFSRMVKAYQENGVAGIFFELKDTAKDVFKGLIEVAGTLWETVKPKLQIFLDDAKAWISNTAVSGLRDAFKIVVDEIGKVFEGTDDVIESTPTVNFRVYNKAGEYLGQISEDTYKEAERTGKLAGEKFSDLWFSSFFTTSYTKKPGNKGLFSSLEDGFKDFIDTAGEKYIQPLWDEVKPYLDKFIDDVSSWVTTTALPKVEEEGKRIGTAFINALVSAATETSSSLVADAGVSIVADLTLGMTQDEYKPKNKLIGIVENAYQATKFFLGSNSPSALFAALGDSIVSGLASGITRSLFLLTSAKDGMLQIINSLFMSIQTVFTNISNIVSLGFNALGNFASSAKPFNTYGVGVGAKGGNLNGPTVVGEKGKELFMPQTSGFLLSNNMLKNIASIMSSSVMARGNNNYVNKSVTYSTNISGVPMTNERSAADEMYRVYQMNQMVYGQT